MHAAGTERADAVKDCQTGVPAGAGHQRMAVLRDFMSDLKMLQILDGSTG